MRAFRVMYARELTKAHSNPDPTKPCKPYKPDKPPLNPQPLKPADSQGAQALPPKAPEAPSVAAAKQKVEVRVREAPPGQPGGMLAAWGFGFGG